MPRNKSPEPVVSPQFRICRTSRTSRTLRTLGTFRTVGNVGSVGLRPAIGFCLNPRMKANWESKYGVRGSRRWRDALELGDISPSPKAATCRGTPKIPNSFKSPLRHVPAYNSNNRNLKFFPRSHSSPPGLGVWNLVILWGLELGRLVLQFHPREEFPQIVRITNPSLATDQFGAWKLVLLWSLDLRESSILLGHDAKWVTGVFIAAKKYLSTKLATVVHKRESSALVR